MITLHEWESHCLGGIPLYYMRDGMVETLPFKIAIVYDDVIKDFVTCFATNNVSFKDIFTTRLQCAESFARELIKKES